MVNWAPRGAALNTPLGTVWVMDLVKHQGRYCIYIPANPNSEGSIFVIHADNIRGPWSEPIDLTIAGCIDPGHAVGEDGKRYLFFNDVRRIALADDGLSTHIKVTNRSNVMTFHYSHDGSKWTQHPWQMEASGFHHNVFSGFLSLKVGIYSTGSGEIVVKQYNCKGLAS